jgi:hypothetical protein
MATIKELERVVLTAPLPNEHLESGDVGAVVHVYRGGDRGRLCCLQSE